jgi:hypothetical protein
MIDNLVSRIIELRAAVNDSETAALDLQMHCVRSLMVGKSHRDCAFFLKLRSNVIFSSDFSFLKRNFTNDLVIYPCILNISINYMK